MKKLLLILLLCLPVCAQTHTEVTQEDAQTISGNKNFTGTNTFSNLITSSTPVVDVRAYSGEDICLQLQTAIAAIGDGTYIVPLSGAQACSVNPFSALSGNHNITVEWKFPVTLTTSAQWLVNASGVVNRCLARGCLILKANASTFPTSTPLLKIGDGSTLIFGTRFEDGFTFDCNAVAGTIRSRNAANSADFIAFSTDASDNVLLYNSVKVNSSGVVTYGSLTFSGLGTPSNGSVVYCSDCTVANPCAGSGTGALAKRINSAWVCN